MKKLPGNEGRWRRKEEEGKGDGAKGCDKRRGKEGEGQSRKRGKWKMHFFFLSLVHMRAQLCVFALSHFQTCFIQWK